MHLLKTNLTAILMLFLITNSNAQTPIINSKGKIILDVHLNNKISVLDLVSIFEKRLGRNANFTIIDKGDCTEISNQQFKLMIDLQGALKENYIYQLIKKYYANRLTD